MTKKGKKPWKNLGPANSALTTTKKTFWAPTKGYKDVFFTSGTAKGAAKFTYTIDRISRYVATSGWKQASALAKVMADLKDTALVAPDRPTGKYFLGSGPDAVEAIDRITLGVVNIPIVGNIDYQATIDEYRSKKKNTTTILKTGTITM